jgi:uncharacterized damage-inducible protein DinB
MTGLETRRIADQLLRATRGPAWHGPSILETLDGVAAEQATARPIPGAHSIHELVLHATTWLDVVRQRLEGTAPDPVPEHMNWPPSAALDADGWRAAVSRLDASARELADALVRLDDGRLGDELTGDDDTWSVYITLHGAAQHLLYHAGQIAILKKGGAA